MIFFCFKCSYVYEIQTVRIIAIQNEMQRSTTNKKKIYEEMYFNRAIYRITGCLWW